MDEKEKAKERRKQRLLAKLGTNHPICSTCEEDDWRCFDAHHIAMRAYDETCVLECKNCHSKLSDAQNDHPPHKTGKSTDLDIIGRFLLGLADWFLILAQKLAEFGRILIQRPANSENAGGAL